MKIFYHQTQLSPPNKKWRATKGWRERPTRTCMIDIMGLGVGNLASSKVASSRKRLRGAFCASMKANAFLFEGLMLPFFPICLQISRWKYTDRNYPVAFEGVSFFLRHVRATFDRLRELRLKFDPQAVQQQASNALLVARMHKAILGETCKNISVSFLVFSHARIPVGYLWLIRIHMETFPVSKDTCI